MTRESTDQMGRHRLHRPTRLVPAVTKSLVDRVVSGEFGDGPVPTEAVFVEEYGVSRTVVREALKVLEEKRLILMAQGRGSYVRPREDWNLLDPVVVESLVRFDDAYETTEQLISVRAAIEGEMTRESVSAMTSTDLERLTMMLEGHRQALSDGQRYLLLDREFHESIIGLSGNTVGLWISRNSRSWVIQPDQLTNEQLTSIITSADSEHWEILRAIAAGDPDRAASAMRAHIRASWARTYALLTDAES